MQQFKNDFYDKYPQLRNRAFLSNMLRNTVYATMALENKMVPEEKIEVMVQKLLSKEKSEGTEFFTD